MTTTKQLQCNYCKKNIDNKTGRAVINQKHFHPYCVSLIDDIEEDEDDEEECEEVFDGINDKCHICDRIIKKTNRIIPKGCKHGWTHLNCFELTHDVKRFYFCSICGGDEPEPISATNEDEEEDDVKKQRKKPFNYTSVGEAVMRKASVESILANYKNLEMKEAHISYFDSPIKLLAFEIQDDPIKVLSIYKYSIVDSLRLGMTYMMFIETKTYEKCTKEEISDVLKYLQVSRETFELSCAKKTSLKKK